MGNNVPIGVGALLIKENKVLMLKRSYVDWGFGVVAGEKQNGETLRETAVNTVKKEVGVKISKDDLNFLCVVHYRTDNEKEAPLVFFFTIEKWVGEPYNKEPERHSQMQWIPMNQPPEKLAPGEHLVLETYKKAKSNKNAYLESF